MIAAQELLEVLEHTPPALPSAPDHRQDELAHDPTVFAEDVLLSGMSQWGEELRRHGHTLVPNDKWVDRISHYPGYTLMTANGSKLDLLFCGCYPDALLLLVRQTPKRFEQFSDAKGDLPIRLTLSMDPNVVLGSILPAVKRSLR